MTTRHSLFTRCLSLVLAFVLVLGNMGGLAVPAKAAGGTNLFSLITGSTTASNAVLRQILTYADVLPDLAAKNQEVAVAANPTEADGYIYNGVLTLNPVDGWEPYSYAVDGVKKLYTEPVEVGEDVFFASATYRTPIQGVGQQVQAVYDYVAEIGSYAYTQQQALNDISGNTAMSALSLMNRTFIEKMITAVESLTVEDLEINPSAEELGIVITVQDLVNAGHIDAVEYTDVDGDGEITEADEAQINAEILANNQAAIDEELNKRIAEEIEKELAETKVEYVTIIKKMLNRLVEDPKDIYLTKYDDIYESFESYLRVYAMLTNYNYDGLLHYYVNAKDIRVELKELSAVLWEILGEKKADGTYENAAVVDAILAEMNYDTYGVSADELGVMAERMQKASEVLAESSSYVDGMNLEDAAAVKTLFVPVNEKGAFVKEATPLVAQFQAAGLNSEIYKESGELYVYPVYEEPTEPSEEPTEPSEEPTEPSEEPTEPSEEPVCKHEYFYECDGTCMICGELTNPDAAHNMIYVEAVAATCYENGNIEYWTCEYCGGCWDNEDATGMPLNRMMVIVPAGHTKLSHYEAIEPACHYNGQQEHWVCYECEGVWTDEACTQLTNIKNIVVPALGGETEHVAESCWNTEYWICYECEQVWANEALTQLTNIKNVNKAEATHEIEHVEESCWNVEYWTCSACENYWLDEALTLQTNAKSVIKPEATHEIEHVEESCWNVEYWTCSACENYWLDEALTLQTNAKSVIKAEESHNLEHVEESCYNIEFWFCTVCETYWADEALTQITNSKNVIKAVPTHNAQHVEAVEPGCHYLGNVEYWTCADCEGYWTDAACTEITNAKSVILPATGSDKLVHVEAVEPACHYEGNIEYWICYECEQVWANEALTQLTNIKNVILPALGGEVVHVEAKAATCYEDGNIEHWYCEDCEQVWQDEALTQLTNRKNVVLGAGHGDIIHEEAVTPSCYEEGQMEHWYCSVCDTVWQDAEHTQITNHLNVVLPAACQSVKHVYAVESTCDAEGNVEYWYCEDCERFWLDENLMQVTNYLSTKTPAGCKVIRHQRAVAPSCFEEGNVKYWYCNDCDRIWLDADRSEVVDLEATVVAPYCQNVEHVAAVAPTCESEGNIEYWYCTDCGQAWLDAERKLNTNLKAVILPVAHTGIKHVAAVAARCHFEGNVEYWYCEDCELVCTDEAMTQVSNHKRVIIPALNPEIKPVPAKRATCLPGVLGNGNVEYWYCPECEQYSLNESFTELTDKEGVVVKGGIHTPLLSGLLKLFLRGASKTGDVTESDAYYSVDACADCDDPTADYATTKEIIVKEATCTEPGLKKTVAVVVLNGVEITSDMESVYIEGYGEVKIEGNGSIEEEIPAKGHDLVHIDGVEAGCHFEGVQEHWYCKTCETVWTDEALTQISNHKNVVIPALSNEADYVAAKEPTCYEEGNVEYWTCAECEKVWTDEALTQLSNIKNVKIAALGHDVEHVAESCYNVEYWVCHECETYWADEELHVITNSKNVIKAEPSHEIVAVEAVAPSCYVEGNIAYWYCEECDAVWQNAELTQLTNFKNVVVPAAHNPVHMAAVEPACHYDGNIEYWVCYACEGVWQNEDLTQLTNIKNVVLPALGGEVEHIEESCYNVEYWTCEDCLQIWTNEALTQLSNIKSVNKAVPSHELVHVEESCWNTEHWYCEACEVWWADEALTQITNAKNVIKAVPSHELEHVEESCYNTEYWFCSACESFWADEALTQVTNSKNVIKAVPSHDLEHVEESCYNTEYWFCSICETYWADEALTQITNSKNVIKAVPSHDLEHVEALDARCHYEGNHEYWICHECDVVWADEALTQITNVKNVIIPAIGTTKLVHMDAVEPGCHMDGNIEYWICYDCVQVWTDEALTQLSNVKNVVLPATGEGNLVHFEAIDPGCHMDGQIEHWTCYTCEKVWTDEALTQLTNSKNVVLPAVGSDELVKVEAVSATFSKTGNVEYWFCAECEKYWLDEALTQLTNRLSVITPELGYCNTAEEPITDIELVYSEDYLTATATISVAPGGWYYGLYRMGEMVLTINGEEVEVTSGGFFMPSTFELINDTTEPMEVELLLYTPVGASSNPAELAMFDNVAEIKANSNGYYFTWTAPEKGTLVLLMPEGDWTYTVSNMTSYIYGETQWSDSDPVVNPAYIQVEAGDELEIIVNTYDPASWNTPAGTLTVNAAFFAPVSVALWSANDYANTDWTQRTEAEGTALFPIAGTYMVGDVLTLPDAQITAMVKSAERAAANQHKTVDADALKELLNDYVITPDTVAYGRHYILVDMIPAKAEVIFDGKPVEVSASDDLQEDNFTRDYFITGEDLGLEEGWIYFLEAEDQTYVIDSLDQRIVLDMDKFLAGTFKIDQTAERVNIQYRALSNMVNKLNEAEAAGSFKVIGEDGEYTLVAEMSLGQIPAFVTAMQKLTYKDIHDDEYSYTSVTIGNADVENGMKAFIDSKIGLAALVNALMYDEEFTSENLIKLAEAGKGEVLHTTMNANDLFEVPFVLKLTSVPEQIVEIGNALAALDGKLSFWAGDGQLHVDTIVPEKVYEAYVAHELVCGTYPSELSNKVALELVLGYVETLRHEDITFDTYINTLRRLGVGRDLEAYRAYYEAIGPFLASKDKFDVIPGDATSSVKLNVVKTDIDNVVAALVKGEMKETYDSLRDLISGEPIDLTSQITFTNKLPKFDAIVIDPTRVINKDFGMEEIKNKDLGAIINDETSLTEKVMAYNMTTNLSAQMSSIYGASIIMLVGDVKGDLTFDHTTILDLNGHDITGNIVANAPVVIIDSNLETVTGAVVDGSVSGNVTILSGNYTANVDAFLRDGYYQDKATGDVKNAMFEFNGTELVVDPSLYIANVDGYLPAAHYLAAEIGVDVVMNYMTGAALYANGLNAGNAATNKIYHIEFNDLVGLLSNKGEAADAILACIDAPALSDLINKILADLVNVDKVADALENREVISTYSFVTYPWDVELEYVGKDNGDYLTMNIGASDVATSTSISLIVDGDTDYVVNIPETDRQYTVQQILDELSEIVVTTDDNTEEGTQITVMINQPQRVGKTLVVGGSADAIINLDLHSNEAYNRVLAAILAYFNEDLTDDLVKNGCITGLNEAMSKVTVGDFFTAVKKAAEKEVPFEKIAEKLGLDLTAAQLKKLTAAYDKFQNTVAKTIARFELDTNASAPLSELADGTGNVIVSGDLKYHTADAYYKNFGVKVELDESSAKLILKLATSDEHVWDEGVVSKAPTCTEVGEMLYTCKYCDATKTEEIPVVDHVPGKAVTEEVDGKFYKVIYCEVCGAELERTQLYLLGDINLDGVVDHTDVNMAYSYVKGNKAVIEGDSKADYIQFEVADVNRDGSLDHSDVNQLYRYIMLGEACGWIPYLIAVDGQ